MDLFGILGIVSLILAYLHFFRPKTVSKIDEIGKNVVITMGQLIEKRRILLGIFYLVVGFVLSYIGFAWNR